MRAGGGGSPTHIPVTKRGGGNLWSWRNGEERRREESAGLGPAPHPAPSVQRRTNHHPLTLPVPHLTPCYLLPSHVQPHFLVVVSGTVLCPADLSPGHRESQDSHEALEPLGWTPQMALESGHINMPDLNWCPKTCSAAFWPGTCSKTDSAFQVPSICKPCFDFCFDCCQCYMVGHLPYTWPLLDTPTLHPADPLKKLSLCLSHHFCRCLLGSRK